MHRTFVLKRIWFTLLFQSLFSPAYLLSFPNIGLYISPFINTENGFFVLGIEISENKNEVSFLAQEMRYHSEKGWEEVLYQGLVKTAENNILLQPNSCQVRANSSFGIKKGLVRRFDCNHLTFEMKKDADQSFLSESLLGTKKNIPLIIELKGISGEPIAISFILPGQNKEEGVWGFHLNGIGKKNPVQIWDENAKQWRAFKTFLPLNSPFEYHIYRWRRTFSD